MDDRVGQQFGNYRLVQMLGHGAFAEVYLGEHRYLEDDADPLPPSARPLTSM